jgi:transcriptional regulator of acetoin/glycerol metabolism
MSMGMPVVGYDIGALSEIIGTTPAMQEIFGTITKVAEYKTTVLITGEAEQARSFSPMPFITKAKERTCLLSLSTVPASQSTCWKMNSVAMRRAPSLMRRRVKKGLLEMAEGGTLFLDEIIEMPLEIQAKLLRVLESGEIMPVGGTTASHVDVRIIAATHRNLTELVAEKRFREDLYYRLKVIRLHIPPLRERREDIPLLVEHFLEVLGAEMSKRIDRAVSTSPSCITKTPGWGKAFPSVPSSAPSASRSS